MELTTGFALTVFAVGLVLLVYITCLIINFDRQYYPKNK